MVEAGDLRIHLRKIINKRRNTGRGGQCGIKFPDFGKRIFAGGRQTGDSGRADGRGVPGEFEHFPLEPGGYALDSVFALLHAQRVNYFAQGVVTGPERPSFEVQAGDSLYLGIWELNLDEAAATARLWRLEADDARALINASNGPHTALTLRQTETISVPCTPHRIGDISQRQVC